jgi:hypothetical protein
VHQGEYRAQLEVQSVLRADSVGLDQASKRDISVWATSTAIVTKSTPE